MSKNSLMRLGWNIAKRVMAWLISFTVMTSAHAQQVFWLGDESCEDLLEQTIPEIPGGFPFKFKMASGEAHYQLPAGGSLQLRLSEAERVAVKGDTFSQAYRNLIAQRPLQDNVEQNVNQVVFASVETGYELDLDFTHNKDLSLFQIKPNGYNIVMNARFSVIDWTGYARADAVSRAKWDKMTCESYHHELGHVLIGAQLFAEAEPDWIALSGRDQADVRTRTDALFDYVMRRVRARQQKYHQEIQTMGSTLSDSRPYTELPFTWLR